MNDYPLEKVLVLDCPKCKQRGEHTFIGLTPLPWNKRAIYECPSCNYPQEVKIKFPDPDDRCDGIRLIT